jgi:hypothetical protein
MVDDSVCPFTISLYPSDTMKDTYRTNNAIIFTVSALGIFAFTSLVFYIYDLKVERRQEHVMRKAVRSSAIVSSLFPSTVRDRLYPEPYDSKSNKFEALLPSTAKGKLNRFIRDGSSQSVSESAPIAELYPETTVLFADVAGFTAWSSERQPT